MILLLCVAMLQSGWLKVRLRASKEIEDENIHKLFRALKEQFNVTQKISLRYLPDTCFEGPLVHGVFITTVYIPRYMVSHWDADELETVLLHELSHVKRKDLWINWLQILVQSVYFFHPLVWWVNNKISILREEACDDLVVSYLEDLAYIVNV